MKTITALARAVNLSRSTLLYYDRIGLLRARYRSRAAARLYSAEEEQRLARIVTFRRAGLPLRTIKALLSADAPRVVNGTLEKRLREIQQQIDGLRTQQRLVVEMLRQAVLRGEAPTRSKAQWVQLLRACAFNEEDMRAWHVALERENPRAHATFLRRIGLPPGEIERVQAFARAGLAQGQPTPSASAAMPKRKL